MKNKSILHIMTVLLCLLFVNPLIAEELFASLHDLGENHQTTHSNQDHHTKHHPGHDLPNQQDHEPHHCEVSHDALLPSMISTSSIKEIKILPCFASLEFTDPTNFYSASISIISESTKRASSRYVDIAQTRAPPVFL